MKKIIQITWLLLLIVIIPANLLIGQKPPPFFFTSDTMSIELVNIKDYTGSNLKIKGIVYDAKGHNLSKLDSVLCKFSGIEYLIVDGEFNTKNFDCLDSLKYLHTNGDYFGAVNFKLNNLREIMGNYHKMEYLVPLLKSDNLIYAYVYVYKGDTRALNDIEFKNIRWFAFEYYGKSFCHRELLLPKGLLNAPNLEMLNFSLNRGYFDRQKYLPMPEIKSSELIIAELSIPCDMADKNTYNQIKKLKKLEYLGIGFSGKDFSIFEEFDYIDKITIRVPYKNWKKRIMTTQIKEEIEKKYLNVTIL